MIPSFEDVMTITREISSALSLEDEDARGLYDCCLQVPRDGQMVETGCQLGRTSSLILQLGQAIGFHCIHIDPYTSQPDFLRQWNEMMWRLGGDQTHAYALLCMRTEQAAWLLSQLGPIDLAFIDGDHEADGVQIDLDLVANKVKPGGLLAVHDYTHDWLPMVKQTVDPYVMQGWDAVGVYGSLGVWRRR